MANEAVPKKRQSRKAPVAGPRGASGKARTPANKSIARGKPRGAAKAKSSAKKSQVSSTPQAVQARRTAAVRKAAAARKSVSAAAIKATRPVSLRGPAQVSGRSGAPEIMVTLNSEHRYISSLLEALAEQADNLLPGRSADYALMHDIVSYMANYPDEYHHPREDLVFGRLLMRDPDAREAVEELLEGHREINRRGRELLGSLERITRSGQPADNQKLKYLCDRYIGHYWEHINVEEGKVFPRATAKLRQDDWFAVNAEAKYVDDPLFGSRVQKEYQRLSQYLADRVSRVTEDIAVAELFGIEALIETVAALGSAGGEIQDIVRRRARATLRASGQGSGLLGIARALSGAAREQAGAGAKEVAAVLRRTRAGISEPFSTRMKFLRRLLREDAG